MRFAVITILLCGCMAVGAGRERTTRGTILAAAGGVAVAGAALAGAAYAHDAQMRDQAGVAIATATIPMAGIFLGEEESSASNNGTPGAIYSNLLGGIGSSFGAAALFMVPIVATIYAGDDVDRPSAANYGTGAGVLAGSAVSVALAPYLPRWGRVIVGALVTGSLATLGYQVAGGGPP